MFAFSWQNSVSLCPVSFCTSRPNFRYLVPFYFCIPVPYDEKESSFGVSFRRCGRSSQKPFNFSYSISGSGIDLDYCDTEWFAMETHTHQSVVFEIVPKYRSLDSFVDYEDYSISSKEFLPKVVEIMVI